MFGSTTLAISTVLATFMGGLGLGSYLAGPLRRPDQEPGARLRARRGGHRPLRAADPADPDGLPGAQQLDVPGVRRSLAAAVDGALRRVGGAAADPDDADGRDAAAAVAPLRDAALGAAALRACASGRSTRSTCSARSRARSSPASSSCRCSASPGPTSPPRRST